MSLTLIHTSPVHVATFDALRDRLAPGTALTHVVREDLLERARADGVTPQIADETQELVRAAKGAVLCTCTTLGEVAERAGALRIDRPLMRRAAQTGGTVLVAYCLESTAVACEDLLREEMVTARNFAEIEPVFMPEAWAFFEAGDSAGFWRNIAGVIRARVEAKIEDDTGCIVLAQASMAGAAPLLDDLDLPVLASPEIAFRTLMAV